MEPTNKPPQWPPIECRCDFGHHLNLATQKHIFLSEKNCLFYSNLAAIHPNGILANSILVHFRHSCGFFHRSRNYCRSLPYYF